MKRECRYALNRLYKLKRELLRLKVEEQVDYQEEKNCKKLEELERTYQKKK